MTDARLEFYPIIIDRERGRWVVYEGDETYGYRRTFDEAREFARYLDRRQYDAYCERHGYEEG